MDFRKVDNYNQKGCYLINNIDLSNCSSKFKFVMEKLQWLKEDNIYWDTELRRIEKEGVTFDIIGKKDTAYICQYLFTIDS